MRECHVKPVSWSFHQYISRGCLLRCGWMWEVSLACLLGGRLVCVCVFRGLGIYAREYNHLCVWLGAFPGLLIHMLTPQFHWTCLHSLFVSHPHTHTLITAVETGKLSVSGVVRVSKEGEADIEGYIVSICRLSTFFWANIRQLHRVLWGIQLAHFVSKDIFITGFMVCEPKHEENVTWEKKGLVFQIQKHEKTACQKRCYTTSWL